MFPVIALYLSSTSNHNQAPVHIDKANIALYLSSTSNHNRRGGWQQAPLDCVISFFYIKPQLLCLLDQQVSYCVISFFYIKPQPPGWLAASTPNCVISFFYIKPQQRSRTRVVQAIALYLSSTSNHNCYACTVNKSRIALYLSSTSNHN